MIEPGPTNSSPALPVIPGAPTGLGAPLPLFPVTQAVAARLAGSPLVVMLDVDGTLAPIVPRPEAATVPPETRRVVARLATRPGVHVALVSGRAAADARRIVAVTGVWVIGNHGFEVVSPEGELLVDPALAATRPAVAQAVDRLSALVAQVPGVIVEDKGWTLSVHYRLADPAAVPRLLEHISQVARATGLRLTSGKMVAELRPPVEVDKGTAVLQLAARLGGLSHPTAEPRGMPGDEASRDRSRTVQGRGAVVFIGDDTTDEDAFRALRVHAPHAVTVRVTHGDQAKTSAELWVSDPAEVREFLQWLLERRS